jgi:radical SAM protein with 4Fe4S-binding SPASM domain
MDGFCGAVYYNAVVTHDGYVSLCTEVDSSSLNTEYGNKFIVSHVSEENPFLTQKSIDFSCSHSINQLEACKTCIVRYKCGGGCYIKRERDFLKDEKGFFQAFCDSVIKLNLSYLVGVYENSQSQNREYK